MLPDIFDLRFDLAAHNWRKAVFGLASNVSVNLRRDLLVLDCFTRTYCPDDIGWLSVNPSGVDTMADLSLTCTAVDHHTYQPILYF